MNKYIKLSLLLLTLPVYVYITVKFDLIQGIGAYFFSIGFGSLMFFCCSLLFIRSEQRQLKRVKNVVLLFSILLVAYGSIAIWQGFPYSYTTFALSMISYCFFFGPLELKYKVVKWSAYTTNRFEVIGLSSFDFIGVNLVLIGIINKTLHWPGQESIIYLGIIILILGILFWNRRFKQEIIKRKLSHDKIKEQYNIISIERERSENLLHNILPEEVAAELKEKGTSEAKDFDNVTVLFTDFVEFTQTAEKLSAKELVGEINTCFKAFDEFMTKYKLEKIKTFGDAYMAAGGLHIPRTSEPRDVVNASIEMQAFMLERKASRSAQNLPAFDMRLGIHTGPVVAGIVGVKKFQYDIWGDTVNTASRMESHGEVGKVNISNDTYQLIKDDGRFTFESRGKLEVKGKGEMEMHFVFLKNSQVEE